ncbi:MAG: hypothetical protein A3C58_03755 [Candidatus Staskawiczbacteria bacterium RIFCSPHIGHO2_02_FULL_34_10]|uniref:Uncharacterized protein n=1 Tax=Candidatus Staskawiczbacteria bacterium RIFCSPHIGHO2_02_FULL_34_10 TaxID=1802205 RepID=A0A1G2HY43_9BACT|nr:MAG: hypothetical protein A3C58_03755 [Candidatus Staskawiczbacteria bacterium RIFCSPHIGHO2_02_FULL_34_10]
MGDLMDTIAAIAIVVYLLIIGLFKKMGWEFEWENSRWDCRELDQDHSLVKGRCIICGKNFRR